MAGSKTLRRDGLDRLIAVLGEDGATVVGPTVRDGVIVYDRIANAASLPGGWTDEQDAGRYRLARRGDEALFGHALGPHSWKRYLHAPCLVLWKAKPGGPVEPADEVPPRLAFLGVRACELAAIAVQDRVLQSDPHYRKRRERVFLVAVNCVEPGGTCFCASMGTGPRAASGYDLALTEVLEGGGYFVVEAASEAGAAVLDRLPATPATGAETAAALSRVDEAARRMGRALAREGVEDFLAANLEHPAWDAVAARCLACANCTQVCPTCFCTTVEDFTDLSGTEARRERRWDSCFTLDFSYLHGGSVRPSHRSRYRQWMTHKLSTWRDQFGTSGCVGCGRCITWCPAGIDITAEVEAMRRASAGGSHGTQAG